MKRPDVDQLLSELTSHEILSWRAFFEFKSDKEREAMENAKNK
jgi:hypothetical protein